MRTSRLHLALLCLVLSSIYVSAQPRGITPADTLRIANVGDVQIAPDASAVCYTVSTTEGNATRTALWCAQLGDERIVPAPPRAAPQQILSGDWNVSRPRWSPDSRRLAFFAARGEQSGIWVMSPRERQQQPRFVAAVRSTNFHLPYAGESFAWSPDSRRLAFIHATDEAQDNAATTSATSEARARRDDPRIVSRIQYKSRTSFSDTLRTHVWLTDVDEPAPRQLTSGGHYDHALTWNPRGEEIAFLSNHEPDPDAVNNSDIFAVSLDGRTRQITNTRGCEYEPAWSPDGKWLAYTATTRDVTTIDSVAEDTHVWVIEAAGNTKARELATSLDRRARSPRWLPDSNSLLFLAGDNGRTTIYGLKLNDRQVHRLSLWGDGGGQFLRMVFDVPSRIAPTTPEVPLIRPARPFQIGNFSIASSASRPFAAPNINLPNINLPPLVFTLGNASTPAEVWYGLGASSVPLRRLSNHNEALVRSVAVVEPEEIRFKSFDGTDVQGWLMKPLNFRESERYPLILSIHGGPHGMFGYSFNAAFQTYAARGYGVLFINPRGSSGYGQKFSDGTLREWGGGDYRDLMTGVDEAVRRFNWIDRGRMGVTGGSYGGFMTNWIITQTPRFRAAVASASVSNLVSFYSTSLYQDLIHAEFGGFPWDDYDLLWRWSPLRYVRAVETPTLFIHGELDNDVHITQAEEMYMALRRRGVETVLARYPREGHGFREPRHREDALERTLAWFDKYLK
jgi:dipeptidyl aminopeptidase/acylaminoacyl peptidase